MKNLFSEKDRNDIKRLIEYASNLVILDKNYGESLETIESRRNSYDYLEAFFKVNKLNDYQNEIIISNYVELNPYYAALEKTYGILPALSRSSKHLSLLKATNSSLSRSEEQVFYEAYYESLEYYNKVTYTKAFTHHPNYNNFIKVFLIWSAIQKYINKQLDNLFNIDLYDSETLKKCFISQGLDYFDTLPLKYQKRLLKKLNSIIANKGTDNCFLEILDIFNIDGISINKYYLVKRNMPNGPVLEFFKTPYDQKLDIKSDQSLSFEEVTSDDIYWKATKEEILEKEFNVINTKYISIESSLSFNKDILNLSYFFNLLEKIHMKGTDNNIYFYNKNISENKIYLYDAFIAITSLALRMNGYMDNILKEPDIINSVYGYGNEDNSIEINDLINEIKKELDEDVNIEDNDKQSLLDFLSNFNINKLNNNYNSYTINEFNDIFNKNEEYKRTLYNYIITTNNYEIYKKLSKIYELETTSKLNQKLFRGYDTYLDYLLNNNIDLYRYCNIDNTAYDNENDIYNTYQLKIIEVSESISAYINNDVVSDAISHSPFYGISNFLEYFITTLILLFKSYTIELKNTYLNYSIKDKKDDSARIIDKIEKEFTKIEGEYVTPRDVIEIIKN